MFTLPKLPYKFNALEPYIDAQTMEIHYTKHHQIYTDKTNETLVNYADLQSKTIEEILQSLLSMPQEIRTAVQNYGGGYYNHNFFWLSLQPNSNSKPKPVGQLAEAVNQTFGNYEKFIKYFVQAATTLFGSGWVWLIKDQDQKLKIIKTANQDSPISERQVPILALDVWEHAYYLKYRNKRADYIEAWWNVVNWEEAEQRFIKK
ncbi:MAG: superoxide dismutase [Patescibacteria group bacterium]